MEDNYSDNYMENSAETGSAENDAAENAAESAAANTSENTAEYAAGNTAAGTSESTVNTHPEEAETFSGASNSGTESNSGSGSSASSFQSAYQSGYRSNQTVHGNYSTGGSTSGSGSEGTGYGSAYAGQSSSTGTGWNSNGGAGAARNMTETGRKNRKNGFDKALLVLLIAAIFGLCVGAGAMAISHVYGNGGTRSAGKARLTLQRGNQDQADASSDETEENAADQKENAGDASDEEDAAGASEKKQEDRSVAKAELTTVEKTVVSTDVTNVVDDVMPAIVSVYNTYIQQYQNWYGQSFAREGKSTGSGFIIAQTDDELLIATNNHVIDQEESLEIQFYDESTAPAHIKGTDADNDLAVIAVDLDDLTDETISAIAIATLGSSDDLKVGETVIAIGNSLGYGQSVTVGVVSALNREIGADESSSNTYVQTDAAINPGNSGGALVDLTGAVIGINSNKIGATQVEGMCYAIPISRAIPIIEDLMNQTTKMKVDAEKQGYLGIRGASVTSQVAKAYNMPEGVYIADLIEGGGAIESDMQKGDIVTKINGTSVTSMEAMQKQLTYYEAGETVTVTVQRSVNGEYKELEIEVTLGSRDSLDDSQESGQSTDGAEQLPPGSGNEDEYGFYGFPWGSFFGW